MIYQACSTIENRNGTMVHWYITFLYNLTFKIKFKIKFENAWFALLFLIPLHCQ